MHTRDYYCRHCGLRIEYQGNWTSAWVHVESKSIWCDYGATMRARP